MKRTLFCLLVLAGALMLNGCVERVVSRGPIYGTYSPEEVWVYPSGCWADGLWYAPCQWPVGPSYGYYRYDGTGWLYYSNVAWVAGPGVPPPRHWYLHGAGPYRYGRPYGYPRGGYGHHGRR